MRPLLGGGDQLIPAELRNRNLIIEDQLEHCGCVSY